MTKEELMSLAKELDIPGRSGMSKEELEEAVAAFQEDEEAETEETSVADFDDEGDVVIRTDVWNRILIERNNRPSEGESDLLEYVVQGEHEVKMPQLVADAFGVNPLFYDPA